MPKQQRAFLIATLIALPTDARCLLLSNGKLVGGGFYYPRLDKLMLAMCYRRTKFCRL